MEANQQQQTYTNAEYIKMIKKHFFINNIPYKKSYNRAKKQVLQEIIIDNNIDINKFKTDRLFLSDYSDFIDAIYVFAHYNNSNKVWKYQPLSNYFDNTNLMDYRRYGYSMSRIAMYCDLNVFDNKYTTDEMWRWIEDEQQEEQEVKEDTDSDSEDEYEYQNYGTQPDGSYMVAGGGMMNGNAYATVEKKDGKYYYCEYGPSPYRKYIGNAIIWSDERRDDGCGEFNIE